MYLNVAYFLTAGTSTFSQQNKFIKQICGKNVDANCR